MDGIYISDLSRLYDLSAVLSLFPFLNIISSWIAHFLSLAVHSLKKKNEIGISKKTGNKLIVYDWLYIDLYTNDSAFSTLKKLLKKKIL